MIKYNLRLQSNISVCGYLFASGLTKSEISDWIKHFWIHIGVSGGIEVRKLVRQVCKEGLTAK